MILKSNNFFNTGKLYQLAQQKKTINEKLISKLKKRKSPELDKAFLNLHTKTFALIDCLDCGNCCRILGPRIKKKDIQRLSKFLGYAANEFVEKYLIKDDDEDFIFKTIPCPFLGSDNYCFVYEYRPKACKEYPHTDARKMKPLLNLALKNSFFCPAVYNILEKLREKYNI